MEEIVRADGEERWVVRRPSRAGREGERGRKPVEEAQVEGTERSSDPVAEFVASSEDVYYPCGDIGHNIRLCSNKLGTSWMEDVMEFEIFPVGKKIIVVPDFLFHHLIDHCRDRAALNEKVQTQRLEKEIEMEKRTKKKLELSPSKGTEEERIRGANKREEPQCEEPTSDASAPQGDSEDWETEESSSSEDTIVVTMEDDAPSNNQSEGSSMSSDETGPMRLESHRTRSSSRTENTASDQGFSVIGQYSIIPLPDPRMAWDVVCSLYHVDYAESPTSVEECCLCTEPLSDGAGGKLSAVVTPCKHYFHEGCLQKVRRSELTSTHQLSDEFRCPLCRSVVHIEEIQGVYAQRARVAWKNNCESLIRVNASEFLTEERTYCAQLNQISTTDETDTKENRNGKMLKEIPTPLCYYVMLVNDYRAPETSCTFVLCVHRCTGSG